MKTAKLTLAYLAALAIAVPALAQETSNPIADFYGAGAYDWTDDLPWDVVFDITEFSGASDMERFEKAQQAAVEAGGGVIYFPAGTYSFTDTLYLEDNVILRGPTPAISSAKAVDFRPGAILTFPKFEPVLTGEGTAYDTAFKRIARAPGTIGTGQGLVNLDINRAGIYIGSHDPLARNLIVFGVRSNNTANPSPDVPQGGQHAWQRYPYRFSYNINVDAYANALVANCRINDKHWIYHRHLDGNDTFGQPVNEADDFFQPGYLIRKLGSDQYVTVESLGGNPFMFSYSDHYGIAVRGSTTTGFRYGLPQNSPTAFRQGAVIRDCWVYCTMRVKVYASGDGLVIKDNVLRDRWPKPRWVHVTGWTQVRNSNTLENRGIDWSGTNVLIEGNDIEVHRHQLNGSGYLSVDGEGILFQECCGGTMIDGITIRNNVANAYIGLYKQPYMRNVLVEGNTLIPGPGAVGFQLYVVANRNGPVPGLLSNVMVRDNFVDGDVVYEGDLFIDGETTAWLENNQISGAVKISEAVSRSGNTRLDGSTALQETDFTIRSQSTAVTPPPDLTVSSNIARGDMVAGDLVTLTATVNDSHPIDRVEFYRETQLIASIMEPPYTVTDVAEAGDMFSVYAVRPTVPVLSSGQDTDSVPDENQYFFYTQATSKFITMAPETYDETAWQAWLATQGLTPAQLADPQLATADLDDDGLTLVEEYVVGGSALIPDNRQPPMMALNATGDLDFVVPVSSDPFVQTGLEFSWNLKNWYPFPHSLEEENLSGYQAVSGAIDPDGGVFIRTAVAPRK